MGRCTRLVGETAACAGRRNLAVTTHRKGETRTAGRDLPDLAHRSLFALACVPCAAGSLHFDTTPPFVWKPAPLFPAGSATPLRRFGKPYNWLKET